MRTHTNEFKEELKVFGRQIQGKIIYYPSYDLVSESDDNILTEADLQIISEQANYDDPIEINAEDIFSISIIKNGDLLQSLMKEFDFESKIELNIGSVVNPQFGLLIDEDYEYLNYGNYIINSKEFNMDTETWSYVCYDKMLFSMVKYKGLSNVEYPITIKQFIDKLCNKVGLEFEDSEFVNQGQLIYEDLYKNRDVTYRDIFDEISKIVAGNLLINDNNKLEVGYPNKASYSENVIGSDITIEQAEEEKILDVELQGDTQQNTSILPSGYTQVDYIQSSGTQYIDTGHYPSSNNDELEIQASYVGGNVVGCLFGCVDRKTVYYQLNKTTTANQFRLITDSGDVFYTFEDYLSKHTYLLDSNILYIDGIEKAVGSGNTDFTGQTLYLFNRNNKGTPNQYGSWRIYSCKIKTNNVLVRNFIPCYRNSDNVVGLYDIVNNVFYTNQGTGAFTYGSVVNIPNPEYPQNINVVTGEQNIQITGENLIKFPNIAETTVNGITYSIQDDVISLNGTATGNIRYLYVSDFSFNGAGDYTITLIPVSGNYTIGVLGISSRNEDKTQQIVWQQVASGAMTNKKTYTAENISQIKNIGFYINSGSILNNFKFKFMFTKGDNIPASFKPYQSQNYLIDLDNIELCKIGDYQDYIYNQNGDWYLHKETNKVVLDENTQWGLNSTGGYRFLTTSLVSQIEPSTLLYCDKFKGSTSISQLFVDGYVVNPSSGSISFCKSDITTLSAWKTWVSSNNLTVYYILATATDIQITDTALIQQLDNLKNATLYNGVNNISVDGELSTILKLDYISEYESINEDYLKDTNVRMSEKIGVINSVAILDSDNDLQYVAEDTQSIKENEMTRVTITDNLIAMNGETQEIANNILNKLNGLYYYANDLQTTGVCYYDFLDLFNVEARGNIYQCLLLNNEITITQGIEEHIFTEKFEELETQSNEYTTSVMTNKQIQFNINQQEGKIESKVEKDGVISAINQSAEEIQINASKLSFEGATINMTADNVKIKGENLDIDSSGVITLTDNSAASSLSDETLHSAYIIKSTDTVERAGTIETLNFINQIVANGRKITLEDNWEYQGTTGGGKAGITEGVYSQPRLTFYSQSNDYDPSYSSGSYQDLDISLNAGIQYTNIQNGTTSTPLIITPTGNITCVSLTQTSKEENKKNFEMLTNAKDILNKVDIYKYNYINEDNKVKKSIGFVIGDDFNYSEEITSTNNDGANIYSMVSVLWQVVKEQQEEINELKEMIKNGKY